MALLAMNLGEVDHDLTVLPNPGIMVSKENLPQTALVHMGEILTFTQMDYYGFTSHKWLMLMGIHGIHL